MTGLRPARRLRVATAFVALAAAVATGAVAQGAPVQAAPAVEGDHLPSTYLAKPENPFSRFEIVSLGSFPIMLFYTGFAFDLERYVTNGFDYSYAPWPFKNEKSASLSDQERVTRISIALGASLIVGGIDAYIRAAKAKKDKRLREAAESASP